MCPRRPAPRRRRWSWPTSLRPAVLRLARRLRQTRDESVELTASQYSVLAALSIRGRLSMGELAAEERVRPPTVTRVVNALADRDLVRRTPAPARRPAEPGRADRGRAGAAAGQPAPARRVAGRPAGRAGRGRARPAAHRRTAAGPGSRRVSVDTSRSLDRGLRSPRPAAPSPPSSSPTTGSSWPARWSPTSAPGCSGWPRTGWCWTSPAGRASPWASPRPSSSSACWPCPRTRG